MSFTNRKKKQVFFQCSKGRKKKNTGKKNRKYIVKEKTKKS